MGGDLVRRAAILEPDQQRREFCGFGPQKFVLDDGTRRFLLSSVSVSDHVVAVGRLRCVHVHVGALPRSSVYFLEH